MCILASGEMYKFVFAGASSARPANTAFFGRMECAAAKKEHPQVLFYRLFRNLRQLVYRLCVQLLYRKRVVCSNSVACVIAVRVRCSLGSQREFVLVRYRL